MGQNQFANQDFGTAAQVLTLGDHLSGGGVKIRPESHEGDAVFLDSFAIEGCGGNGKGVAAALEFDGQGKAGVQVAERAHRGEEDFLRHS